LKHINDAQSLKQVRLISLTVILIVRQMLKRWQDSQTNRRTDVIDI